MIYHLKSIFLKLYPNIPCFAFDGTISSLPSQNPDITFIKKNIGSVNNESLTNLHEYFEKYDNIFIKMDIEGHEFEWLSTLNTKQIRKIRQFVVEFHYPINNIQNWSMLEKLKKNMWLIHLHAHNGCRYNKYLLNDGSDLIIPNLIECTYIRREFLEYNNEPVPSSIDQMNSPEAPHLELILNGYPYNILPKNY